jgi:hypothetical protein
LQSPEPQPLDPSEPLAAPPAGAEPRARGRRRMLLLAGVVAVMLLAGGLIAHRLGNGSGNGSGSGEPVRHNGANLVPAPAPSVSGAVPSSAAPSRSLTASPSRHSPAPASAKVGSPPPTSKFQPIITGTGVITHSNGTWCVDLSPSRTLQVWDCNHTPPQTWTVEADGRLSALSGSVCMMPVNDARTTGTAIEASTCSGTDSAQIWRQQANSTIVNTASGLCLSPGTFAYTSPFALQTCTDDSIEQWTLPAPN